MSLGPGNSGWNNNIQRTYFSPNSSGNGGNQPQKKKFKKAESTDEFNSIDEVIDDIDNEINTSFLCLVRDFFGYFPYNIWNKN